eukprot:TRINITY_DN15850_c0_g1_i1.p1 TRINITY_DN15850_c0_g1~~TRINITY_DN15850_c0_g1_i1.p1  ORF type:complete len:599 (+),score=191.63 TRINITY_DN15850_c0_g1_i1:245-2041(+)
MQVSVHTKPPTTDPPDQFPWQVTEDAPIYDSLVDLLTKLKKKKLPEGDSLTAEDFRELYILYPATKENPQDHDYIEADAAPIPWDTQASPPVFETGVHFFLRKKQDGDDEKLEQLEKEDAALEAGEEAPPSLPELPDEPPPPLGEDPAPETGVGTTTADIPRYNEVQVSGQLPLQHLKISTLSWKGLPKRGTDGLRSRPVSTATMCPSCGTPFAMNIPDSVMKDKMLTNDMERQLGDALEAQRSVLEGEKKMLEAEVNDLKTALNSINASLSRSREDGEELAQLAEQQRQWTEWLEVENRQTKGEITQVASDFDSCLKSNQELTGMVEQAIAKRVEDKYWTNASQRGGLPAQPSSVPSGVYPSQAPQPLQYAQPVQHVHQPVVPLTHSIPAGPPLQPPSPLDGGHVTPQQPAYSDPYSARTAKRDRFRDLVTAYYQRHNPTKLGLVETLVDEYEGKERELLNLMARKYGDVSVLGYDPLIDDDLASRSSGNLGYEAGPADLTPYPAPRSAAGRRKPSRKMQSLLESYSDKDDAVSSSLSGFSDLRPGAVPKAHHLSAGPSSDPSKVTFELPPSTDVYRPGTLASRGPPPLQPGSSQMY